MYHFFRQLWLVLGVFKLLEINSNWFSRQICLFVAFFGHSFTITHPPVFTFDRPQISSFSVTFEAGLRKHGWERNVGPKKDVYPP